MEPKYVRVFYTPAAESLQHANGKTAQGAAPTLVEMAVDKRTGSTQLAVAPHWSSGSAPRSSSHSAPPRNSTLLTKPETLWPPPPSLPYVPITTSGLRSTAPMASTSLSMDVVSSKEQPEKRPATARAVVARHDARPLSGRPATAQQGVPASPRSGSAEWRLHTPRTPAPTRPAGPRTTRAPRCEAASSSSSSSTAPAVATLGEAPGLG